MVTDSESGGYPPLCPHVRTEALLWARDGGLGSRRSAFHTTGQGKRGNVYEETGSHGPETGRHAYPAHHPFGKPGETPGRKAIGPKAAGSLCRRHGSLVADYKGKPGETPGRKTMDLRRRSGGAMAAGC